jgi:hypothetical protein
VNKRLKHGSVKIEKNCRFFNSLKKVKEASLQALPQQDLTSNYRKFYMKTNFKNGAIKKV